MGNGPPGLGLESNLIRRFPRKINHIPKQQKREREDPKEREGGKKGE